MDQQHIGNRYHRQIQLKDFGMEAQQKLAAARVLVIGAGGLGCPALLYLTAAGIGTIGIADHDRVQVSNLHRQVLFTEADIGSLKVTQAIHHLRQRNQEINLIPHTIWLAPTNCFQIFEQYDIVLDGTDNFSTRYMINDACYLLGKPLVMGAISQYEGQVALFRNKEQTDVNYRDIFPNPPREGEIKNCAEAGVLGILPGIIGIQMANEAIKLITGIGHPLIDQMFTYHALTNQSAVFDLASDPGTRNLLPANRQAFEQTDYRWLCGEETTVEEILPDRLQALLEEDTVTIMDVREWGETPTIDDFHYIQIPLSELSKRIHEIPPGKLVIFCQSGIRSKQAARLLQEYRNDYKTIFSLAGGIFNWLSTKNIQHGT